MSKLTRFCGALRPALSRAASSSTCSSSSYSFSSALSLPLRCSSSLHSSTCTSSSHSFKSSFASLTTSSTPKAYQSTAPAATATASEVVTSEASTPGALPVGYIDEYHNHGHRHMPGDPTKRAFTYLILGTTQFIAASAARVAILKLIYTMSASADVLALGSVEVDLSAIPLGESATIKWRGKPVFIRHRTGDEIELAAKDDGADLRHNEADIERVQKAEWLVVLGVCTHLGCVPIANAGDYQGWFCPCHGSHYDVSGRIRKGPAPLNLEVPEYRFIEDDSKMILG